MTQCLATRSHASPAYRACLACLARDRGSFLTLGPFLRAPRRSVRTAFRLPYRRAGATTGRADCAAQWQLRAPRLQRRGRGQPPGSWTLASLSIALSHALHLLARGPRAAAAAGRPRQRLVRCSLACACRHCCVSGAALPHCKGSRGHISCDTLEQIRRRAPGQLRRLAVGCCSCGVAGVGPRAPMP